MKKILLPFLAAVIFTACQSKTDEVKRDIIITNDSTGAASNTNADTAKVVTQTNEVTKEETKAPVVKTQKTTTHTTPTKTTTTTKTETPATQPVATAPTTSNENTTVAEEAPAEPTKKGASNTVKGAVIGGVAGAAAGAVIGKNAKGAVIGGVLGAAGGAIIGKQKDKKKAQQQSGN